jgi:hypothetical protein
MKSMLYIGAALMAGAAIYGFVDYNKTNQTKEFGSLYKEAEKKTSGTEEVVIPEKKTITHVKYNEASPAINEKKETTTKEKSNPANNKKKATKDKKLNYKLFSRAPLREFEPETPAVPKVKKMEEVKNIDVPVKQ